MQNRLTQRFVKIKFGGVYLFFQTPSKQAKRLVEKPILECTSLLV
jgi:hypothetical protein